MTRAEAVLKFGEGPADAIILRKLGDETLRRTQVRDHPEAPDCPELRQYLILDTSEEVDESEDVLEQLYSAADRDSSSSSLAGSSRSTKAWPLPEFDLSQRFQT